MSTHNPYVVTFQTGAVFCDAPLRDAPLTYRDLKRIENVKLHFFDGVPPAQRKRLHIDRQAAYSVTESKMASFITRVIGQHMPDKRMSTATITDGTACIGSNVIDFARHFKTVNAVELDHERFEMLRDNMNMLGIHAHVVEGDITDPAVELQLRQDVLYLAPPWGGPGYKEKAAVSLTLGGQRLVDVCVAWAPMTRYIALKLPFNFDFTAFNTAPDRLPFEPVYCRSLGYHGGHVVELDDNAASHAGRRAKHAHAKMILLLLRCDQIPAGGQRRAKREFGTHVRATRAYRSATSTNEPRPRNPRGACI